MLPELIPGQNILSFNWAYLIGKPKKGDIVVIKQNGKEMVKRVQKVTQSVIPTNVGIQIKVFVTGDNSQESTDSRHFGPVNMDQIIGKVIYY